MCTRFDVCCRTLVAIDGTLLGPDLLPVPGGFSLGPDGRMLRPNGKPVPIGVHVGCEFMLLTPEGVNLPDGERGGEGEGGRGGEIGGEGKRGGGMQEREDGEAGARQELGAARFEAHAAPTRGCPAARLYEGRGEFLRREVTLFTLHGHG
jgi:hypothetical protein